VVESTARSFGFELQGTLVGCRLFLISSHQELGANRLRRDGGNDVNDPEPTWTGLKSRSAALEVYDIAGNTLAGAASLGAVGLDWQLGGFAADPPSPSTASMGDSSQAAQLVQTMAGFNGAGPERQARREHDRRDRGGVAELYGRGSNQDAQQAGGPCRPGQVPRNVRRAPAEQ
jgi:hypothetical protein